MARSVAAGKKIVIRLNRRNYNPAPWEAWCEWTPSQWAFEMERRAS